MIPQPWAFFGCGLVFAFIGLLLLAIEKGSKHS